jgi:hypothetical protein
MYLCVRLIEVPVSSQESERSCICVLGLVKCLYHRHFTKPNTQIHDRSLSWLDTGTSVSLTHKYMTLTFLASYRHCSKPNTQINDCYWSACIKPGKWAVMYLCVRLTEVPVSSQESERSCICVLGLDTGTSVSLTHKYMTAHFPGLIQALQ